MPDEEHPSERFRRFARTALAHWNGGRSSRHDAERAREVYQSSTMGALIDGVYDGDVTVGELLRHGDFGLGTFNHLDGEMLVLDGVCYHLRADGSVEIASDSDLSPFAAMTHFSAGTTREVSSPMTRGEVTALIDRTARSTNLMYAVKVTGHFSDVRTRTVKEQKQPYPPLTEAAAGQAETVFSDLDGTLGGYRTPDYEQGISVAGYHLHFIDDSHSRGGHCLDFTLQHGTIELTERSELQLSLPTTEQFLNSDLTPANLEGQIKQAEGG
ncbi:acetolactate decarboxylase [Streptomyces sp. NBC_01476]|uniref:acetolactate decarboxylase n=1 Tax=Streptomyces sp. NBC_01476 TaxID=2903881 RepID=UPI002E378679|nr:acetolactate decarboxylase [Streptomyces sp. NBC_01476]